MSTTTLSLFCLNAECENTLSEFEIKKRNPQRVSRYWFCYVCRRSLQKYHLKVRCAECEIVFEQHNLAKYCDECSRRVRGVY